MCTLHSYPLPLQYMYQLGVAHIRLIAINLSAPGVCYDEGDECRHYAREGKCTNSALHQYANFCMMSCGLCGKQEGERKIKNRKHH